MKKGLFIILFILSFTVIQKQIFAQSIDRQDAIWARLTNETITLDGELNEAAWSKAESVILQYEQSAGLPTSAWRQDPNGGPGIPTDPTYTVVKFLATADNKLYISFDSQDKIVGGIDAWANWDGILMSVKRRNEDAFILEGGPSSPTELFYSFWYDTSKTVKEFGPGTPPVFRGYYDNTFVDTVASVPSAFDAYWKTNGITNDSTEDNGWVVEMCIGLDTLGVDLNKEGGDILELNFSVWDKDYTQGDPQASYLTRTWWQNPWNSNDNPGKVYMRTDVTVDSPTLPDIEPDNVIPNGQAYADPVIDGLPDEEVWNGSLAFDVAWDNLELRKTYKGAGPFRSGRFQPELDLDGDGTKDPKANVADPVVGHIKAFFKGNYLYFSADVEDKIVQGVKDSQFDIFDAVTFRIGDRDTTNADNILVYREMGIYFDTLGMPSPLRNLPEMAAGGFAEYAVHLKGNTIVNDQSAIDDGYSVEMKIDLSYFGYPYDDKAIFWSVLVQDGDQFDDDPLQNYGTRSYYFGERGNWSISWGYLDDNTLVAVDELDNISIPNTIELAGNYPNPFNPETKIRYSLPYAGNVEIHVFNVLGERVDLLKATNLSAGVNEQLFSAKQLSSGVYFYKIILNANSESKKYESRTGKLVLMK